jgi:hypothetical protein
MSWAWIIFTYAVTIEYVCFDISSKSFLFLKHFHFYFARPSLSIAVSEFVSAYFSHDTCVSHSLRYFFYSRKHFINWVYCKWWWLSTVCLSFASWGSFQFKFKRHSRDWVRVNFCSPLVRWILIHIWRECNSIAYAQG